MEADFKKSEEDDGVGGGSSTNVKGGVLEGVGDFRECIEETSKEGRDVLEHITSGKGEEGFLHKGVIDDCMDEGILEGCVLDGVMGDGCEKDKGGENLVHAGQADMEVLEALGVKEKPLTVVFLDWKKAVLGGSEERSADVGRDSHKGEMEGKCVTGFPGSEGAEMGDGDKVHEESNVKGPNKGGGPVKMCREIMFDEGGVALLRMTVSRCMLIGRK